MRVTAKYVALPFIFLSLFCSSNDSRATDTNGNALIFAPPDGYTIWPVNDIENV